MHNLSKILGSEDYLVNAMSSYRDTVFKLYKNIIMFSYLNVALILQCHRCQ